MSPASHRLSTTSAGGLISRAFLIFLDALGSRKIFVNLPSSFIMLPCRPVHINKNTLKAAHGQDPLKMMEEIHS